MSNQELSPSRLFENALSEEAVLRINKAVEDAFEEQVLFLQELVRAASLRGQEKKVQELVATALEKRGYDVQSFGIDPALVGRDPAFSPSTFNLNNSRIVVGSKTPRSATGKSLALNAHVDVVPVGTNKRWKHEPFSATRGGDWLYGRGAGDMKAGLTANLFALDALSAAGFSLKGPIQIQSVIEEESTGNGAAMVLAKGFRADAILVSEPTGEKLVSANTGVMKFAVTLQGVPAHPMEVSSGKSAIDIAIRAIEHLRELENEWLGERGSAGPEFRDVDNPVALTIGTISGGEWLASVPSECRFEGRIGFYPGESANDRASKFERFLIEAFRNDPSLSDCPLPEIEWVGVKQGGYCLPQGSEAEALLSEVHKGIDGLDRDLERFVMPCYLDAAVFTLHGRMTSLVYGPTAENCHALDERVNLSSLKRVTKAIALFAAGWCGVEQRA
ncbi:MAG: ArgE/DapE family deacylase [Mesorhizobium sp.]|nr:MAG: ArgE/DapE family deacylase [Mesorhizobium sp.]